MCNLRHLVNIPDQNGGSPTAGAANDADALDANMQPSEAAGATAGPSSHTEMQPTKFGKLLKVVLPLAAGAGVGGFGGNWRVPGSGNTAAQNFFGQQAQLGLRKQELNRASANDQFRNALEYAKAQHEMSIPPFGAANAGRTWKEEVDGKTHVFRSSPYTGNPEDLGEAAPPKTTVKPVATNQGMQAVETSGPEPGKTTPMMTQGSQQPDVPVLVGNPGVPMEPPTKPVRPQKVTSRNARGEENDYEIDPSTQQRLSDQPVATREPKPRAASKTTPKPDSNMVEQVAQAALSGSKGDGDKAIAYINQMKSIPEGQKEYYRQRVRELKRPGQPAPKKKNYFQNMPSTSAAAPGQ